MKADVKMYSALEDIVFKYERTTALVEALQMLVTEGTVEIRGLPQNTLEYSLYEISCELGKTNQEFVDLISKGEVVKENKTVLQEETKK